MIFLDIETLDFFADDHIKALPRDQQLKAMRFGCAVTCFVNDEVATDEPVWQEWTANQIDALYHYLCWANQQICGWNTLAFDWPVILNCAEMSGVRLLEIEHETVRHADLFDFIRQATGRWYSLETVAQANLGRGKLADGQKAAEWLRSGDAVLPDGRTVHGRAATTYERATNAVVVHFVDLVWLAGEPLTADEYNTELGEHGYLHEFVTDKLLLMKPEDEDFPWPV